MIRKQRRFISLLLSVVMLASLLAVPAEAAGLGRIGSSSIPEGGNSYELELYPVHSEYELQAVPSIYGGPMDYTVPAGTEVCFYVNAYGTGTITYQWQYMKPGASSWINVSAESGKTAVYTLRTETRHNGYQYRCRVTNSSGSAVSRTALLTVVDIPKITAEPTDVTAAVGGSATFSLTASGSGTLSYQWQYSTDGGETWTNVSTGGTSRTYTLSSVAARHFGYLYHCVVKVANGGSVTSNTVKLIEQTSALTVSISPASLTVTAGETATFKSTVSGGTKAYSYRWQYRTSSSGTWTNVSTNGTSADYSLKTAVRHNGYQYRLTVTDAKGAVKTSGISTLHVNSTPSAGLSVSVSPATNTVTVGETATFTSSVSGGKTPYSYRWQYRTSSSGTWTYVSVNGTYATYSLTTAARHNGYQYRLEVTDASGTKAFSSNYSTLVVNSTPVTNFSVTISPETNTVTEGNQAQFLSTVRNGTRPFTYRWQYRTSSSGSWTNVATNGAGASLSLTASGSHNGYQYQLIVVDATGASATSNAATLYVQSNMKVTVAPSTTTVDAGKQVTFTSTVSGGTKPYTYQWKYRTSSTGSWTKVSLNGTSATYTLTTAARHNGYQYQLEVTDANGGVATSTNIATLNVTVPVKYRALVIGQNAYTSRPLKGCINDADGMKLMLTSLTNKYTVTEKTDLTASQIVASINSTFADATDNDVSLFYYSGHGVQDTGTLVGVDDYGVSLDYLASMLSNIPGHVIVILDSCYSGMLIHSGREKEELARINENIIATFRKYDHGTTTAGLGDETNHSLTSSHFSILTASAYNESSEECYIPRGAFTDAFLKGLGHAFNESTVRYQPYSGSMPADTSGNLSVSLIEAYLYAYNGVKASGYTQNVQYFGTGSRELFWH